MIKEFESKINIKYDKVKLTKRWFSFIIDFLFFALLTFMFSSLTNLITRNVSPYKDKIERREEIQSECSLYKDGELVLTYVEKLDDTLINKASILNNAIESFYYDDFFFASDSYYLEYQNRKKNATNKNGEYLFVEAEDKPGYYIACNYTDNSYYSFYYNEISQYCISYMLLNEEYANLLKYIQITSIIEYILCGAIAFIVTFIVVPLILKRGRKTIGMYIFKISLIDGDFLNVRGKKLVIRNILLFFVGYCLSVLTFCIPLIISLLMMHLSKEHQDLFDYLTKTYAVDASQDVYLNYDEYLSKHKNCDSAGVENNDC